MQYDQCAGIPRPLCADVSLPTSNGEWQVWPSTTDYTQRTCRLCIYGTIWTLNEAIKSSLSTYMTSTLTVDTDGLLAGDTLCQVLKCCEPVANTI